MGNLPGDCARSLFYPDWSGTNEGCIDDGNQPAYMTDNAVNYLFSQLEDCCMEHYQWMYNDCVGKASTATSGLYYPDFSDPKNICKNDGAQPQYMNNSPSVWMHDTLKGECCSPVWNGTKIGVVRRQLKSFFFVPNLRMLQYELSVSPATAHQVVYIATRQVTAHKYCPTVWYRWNYSNCLGSTASATSTSTGTGMYFMSWAAGKCVLDGGPEGDAQNWDILYSTRKTCCAERNWWNNKCNKD